MALYGFCDGSVAVCLCVCWLEALISNLFFSGSTTPLVDKGSQV